MKKKLVKYIKFFVSITLILSLVAPSYASLSASDGSAFVTKSEFDSALADFNARLTTFEAGINSKIDSQVTSYLDRNGIWSGATQTLYANYIWARWKNSNASRDFDSRTWYPSCYGALTMPDSAVADTKKLLSSTQCLVHETSKAGLMNITFDVKSAGSFFGFTGNDARSCCCWDHNGGTDWDKEANDVRCVLQFFEIDKVDDPSSFTYTNAIDKTSHVISTSQRTHIAYYLYNSEGRTSTYFFVNKNKSIIMTYSIEYVYWFMNSKLKDMVNQGKGYGTEPGQMITFNTVQVY